MFQQTLVMPGNPITWERKEPPYKYAIIKHLPRNVLEAEGMPYAPDVIFMQDAPRNVGPGTGHDIPIFLNWWEYIKKINNPKGYDYTRSIGSMWINNEYDQSVLNPQPPAWAQSSIGGGNFIAYDRTDSTGNWFHLVAHYHKMDTRGLDPMFDNWYYRPAFFWYPVAINMAGKMIKVWGGDVFFPLIKYTELWLHRTQLELFPDGYNYVLKGTDVYDGNTPLMTVAQNRVRTFHSNWRLDTVGVIPPVGWGT